jgi:peptide/nickel transport system permease protein
MRSVWRNQCVHRTGWTALARIGSTLIASVAITLVVFLAFYAVPSKTSFTRRGPTHRLSEPVLPAYVHYVWAFVRHGSLGHSFVYREAVTTRVLRAAPVTLSLLLGGLFFAALFSLAPLLRPRSRVDRGVTLFAVAGISIHPVWLSLLSWLFGAHWGVLPEQGYCGLTSVSTGCDGVTHWASHLLLPWIVLGLVTGAYYSLGVGALLCLELHEGYVVQARAKGVRERRIVRVHMLRNLAGPLLALAAMNVGVAFSAVVFIESIFSLPGLGQMFRFSLRQHDLPVTAGIVLVATLTVLALSAIADLAALALRPRTGSTPRAVTSGRRGRRSMRTSSPIVPASAPPAPPVQAP